MTLDEYIASRAARGPEEGFLRRFANAEIFFSLPSKQDTEEQETMPEVELQLAKLSVGSMGLFYASKEDARLGTHFAGLPLIRAAQMVCDAAQVDGLLLQSSGDAWFVARKEALREVIGQVRDQTFYQDFR